MRPRLFDLTYFETYYFANIINNILEEPLPYLVSLNDFFGENNYKEFLEPFPKITRLHNFIIFILDSINYENTKEAERESFIKGERNLWIEVAFEYFEFEFDTFDKWLSDQNKLRSDIDEDDIADYLLDMQLCGPYEELLERMADEIFFVIFLNRQTLQRFNIMISHQIRNKELNELDVEDLPFFKKNGVLNRMNIPKWVKRAVLHRDRGMCVNCNKDLTGQINIGGIENFDHIVPLAIGGINDITNIQLLCETCNQSKQAKNIQTSIKYEKWY